MYQKILVCLDGSSPAWQAAKLASFIADRLRSEVIALNVFEPVYSDGVLMGAWTLAMGQDTLNRMAARRKKSIKDALLPIFERDHISCCLLQEIGHPVNCIVKTAEQEAADLIVVGNRGLTGFSRFLLGSTSDGVLHHAHCSVLIARGENASRDAGEIHRILLASDGSTTADQAAVAAIGLARAFTAQLDVLNVFDPTPPWFGTRGDTLEIDDAVAIFDSEEYERYCLERVREEIASLTAAADIDCQVHQERGAVGQTIVRYAAEHAVDLIVIGSRGLRGFPEALLGSASKYVANHAENSVLVVR